MRSKSARTRIKVCGMTEPEMVISAINLGVDAIGMILHADSPRTINTEQALKIREVVPAFVTLVGVFVNASAETLAESYQRVGLDLLQLHGEEDVDFAQNLGIPYIKAVRARSVTQVARDVSSFHQARAILLDPYVKGKHGGTGQPLNLDLWPSKEQLNSKLILAGGLSPDNLAHRLKSVNPFAVDLNSGIEESPGKKSISMLNKAVSLVRAHDAHNLL